MPMWDDADLISFQLASRVSSPDDPKVARPNAVETVD